MKPLHATPFRVYHLEPRTTHSTQRPPERPRTFPSQSHELKSIIHHVASNPDALLSEEIITSTDPDTILDFSITSRNAPEEFEHLVQVTDSMYALTLFGYGNKTPFTRLEKVFEEMKIVTQSFDLHDREDGQALQGAITRLTGDARYPKVLLKGRELGTAEEVVEMALNGTLVDELKQQGVEAEAGDPYILREIVEFW